MSLDQFTEELIAHQSPEAQAIIRVQLAHIAWKKIETQRARAQLSEGAYVPWKFLGQLCQRAGPGKEPRQMLHELSELRAVDVVLPTKDGNEIRTRCVTQPGDHQKCLLERLGLQLPGRLHKIDLPWKNRASVSLRRKHLRQSLGKLG